MTNRNAYLEIEAQKFLTKKIKRIQRSMNVKDKDLPKRKKLNKDLCLFVSLGNFDQYTNDVNSDWVQKGARENKNYARAP